MTTPRSRKSNAPDMTSAPEPQDHKSPAQREAEGDETIAVEFRGAEFTVPADQDDWPTIAVQAFAKGLHIDAIEALLGPLQWAQFNVRFPKRRDFNEFSEVLAKELGFGTAGN